MSNSPKNEPIVSKEARTEQEAEKTKSYIISGATALDQINISIKFKSRDDAGPNVDTVVKHNTDLQAATVGTVVKHNTDLQAPSVDTVVKHNTDLQAPSPGSSPRQNYVTLEQFQELQEQVRRLAEQNKLPRKTAA
ncbi:MAG: hypothetical protein JO308_12145 [Verrucomicrobia bacterium]|nr:hypothetical protein [Verrucomicrobiota bacterium]